MKYSCSDECGRTEDRDEVLGPPPGWERLQITGRLRCPECRKALEAVNRPKESGAEGVGIP